MVTGRVTLTGGQVTLCPNVDLHLQVQIAVVSLHLLLLHQRQRLLLL